MKPVYTEKTPTLDITKVPKATEQVKLKSTNGYIDDTTSVRKQRPPYKQVKLPYYEEYNGPCMKDQGARRCFRGCCN